MRFDTPIWFVRNGAEQYNPETGDYEADGDPEKELELASVNDTKAETMVLIYGKIRQGSLTVRIQGQHAGPFDYIEIDGKKYSVDQVRQLRTKTTYFVSEVQ